MVDHLEVRGSRQHVGPPFEALPLDQSCKLIDVSPFAYLKDVLLRTATHPQRLIHQLTPRGWAATFASSTGLTWLA